MHIRPAKASDRDAIIAFDQVAAVEESRESFIERSIDRGNAFVGVEGNRVVGYAVLDYSFYENGFVSMLYIDAKHRRKGFGGELMRYVESVCKTRKLFTSTNESNEPMQALLKNLGYARSGIIENLDEGDPEIVYFKLVMGHAR